MSVVKPPIKIEAVKVKQQNRSDKPDAGSNQAGVNGKQPSTGSKQQNGVVKSGVDKASAGSKQQNGVNKAKAVAASSKQQGVSVEAPKQASQNGYAAMALSGRHCGSLCELFDFVLR